jgi:hypothetical protein
MVGSSGLVDNLGDLLRPVSITGKGYQEIRIKEDQAQGEEDCLERYELKYRDVLEHHMLT